MYSDYKHIPEEYNPISPWGYIGYSILFVLPVIGIIFLIVFSLSDKNINRRNYARSYFCVILIAIIVSVIVFSTGMLPFLQQNLRRFSIIPTANAITLTKAAEPAPTETPIDEPWYVTEGISTKGVSQELLEITDQCVIFLHSYIDFMVAYQDSDHSLAMLGEYFEMMKQYTDMMESVNAFSYSGFSNQDTIFYMRFLVYIEEMMVDVYAAYGV